MKLRKNNYAFVDSQNLNLAVWQQGWILDFGRFRRYLKEKYSVEKALLFIGYVPSNQELYTRLQSQGYILISRLHSFVGRSAPSSAGKANRFSGFFGATPAGCRIIFKPTLLTFHT